MSRGNAALKQAPESDRVQDFLNAAHGFETSSREFSRRTKFATVLTAAYDADLVSKHELKTIFGISSDQLSRAKDGRKTGISAEERSAFISAMKRKATATLEAR